MAIDERTPVRFNLPDGDSVDLYPWPGIIDKITEPLTRMTTAIALINTSLEQINDRVDYWISQQTPQL